VAIRRRGTRAPERQGATEEDEMRWARIIDSIQEHRSLWFVNFEAYSIGLPSVKTVLREAGTKKYAARG
jgi:hypothetical protein